MTITGTDFLAPDLTALLTSTAPATRPRRRIFPGDPAQVAHARRFVQRTLAPHGPAADAALLAGELATNADAPRGALLYPRRSREELKGGSWA